jgi:hypothetical protein
LIAGDVTSTVLVDGHAGGVEPTQAAIVGLTGTTTSDGTTQLSATSTARFTGPFPLTHTKMLDFLIDGYYLPDNGGGVALNI